MTAEHSEHWLNHFRSVGFSSVEPLAVGMEGAVYRLGDGQVAKVWTGRTVAHVEQIKAFEDDLAAVRLPFSTPRLRMVADVRGTTASFEDELHGTSLQSIRDAGMVSVESAMEITVSVLEHLRSVPVTEAIRSLPLLDDEAGPYVAAPEWGDALASFVERRIVKSGHLIAARLPNFGDIAPDVSNRLRSNDLQSEHVIHGDFCPANILVDDDLCPTAVLDFGFLSTGGDWYFDAAVAAAIFDMYSPEAGRNSAALLALLDVPADVASLYLAAYGMATATAYDPNGNDGHFDWCVGRIADFASRNL